MKIEMKPIDTAITRLFEIQYPIIQAGMIWCSEWQLAAAVSNAGGLGILGSGSMYPQVLKEQIQMLKANCDRPFAVNIPLLYPDIEQHIETIIAERVPIVFSSAGNPATWTTRLKAEGIKVVHVVSNVKFAQKAQDAGVDAIVAEGFEAGGHNGREETTTLCLIPLIKKAVSIPVIAAGGIGSGAAMLSMMALGADAVQVGTRFVTSLESSAHLSFKEKILQSVEGDTHLAMKNIVPVRLLKNKFADEIKTMEATCKSKEEILAHLGRARAKKGMHEGDMEEGELEIGQVAAHIDKILTAKEIIEEMMTDFYKGLQQLQKYNP